LILRFAPLVRFAALAKSWDLLSTRALDTIVVVKASFIPGDLHLNETPDGFHTVTMQGAEILRTRSASAAKTKFTTLRREMETKYPARELTAEEKAEMWRKATADALVGHNSLGGRKKKTNAGGTRTFGG
jgi:hypothetical protein